MKEKSGEETSETKVRGMGRVSHCGKEVLLWMGLSLLCFSSYWPLLSKDAHTVSFLSLSYLVFELLKANACVVSCALSLSFYCV